MALERMRFCTKLLSAGSASSSDPTNGSDMDLAALLAFKSQLADPLGILADNWTTGTSFCHWVGVSCSRRRQRVTALLFSDMPLVGTVAPHVGNLSFLSVLNLTNTSLIGSIPAELGRLHRLTYLSLTVNSLSSVIPSTLGNLTRLEYLSLSLNRLSGHIHLEMLMRMHNLRKITLLANDLSGQIPPYLFNNTPSLTFISFGNNSLSGPIPYSITSLSMLEHLNLQINELSGLVPQAMYNMSRLQNIYLGRSGKLSGTFLSNKSFNLPMLQIILLAANNFAGRFPSGLASCQYLQKIYLSENSFADVVPTWLAKLSHPQHLSLSFNNLVGTIPAALGNLTSLNRLDLVNCNLKGGIPPELSVLQEMSFLHLASNRLIGKIPAFLGNLSRLSYLYIFGNELSGEVPTTLGKMAALNELALSYNNLEGNLDFLAALSKCRQLQLLELHHNLFTGTIPRHVGNLTSGLKDFGACLTQTYAMDISSNLLIGSIPKTFGQLSMLIYLNLSHNSFKGSIPGQLKKVQGLASLDLSSNNLSGTIPIFLANFTYLNTLNLSFNRLDGQIPEGGVFSNLTLKYFVGNAGLCGAPQLGFPPCLDKTHSSNRHLLQFILPTLTLAFGAIVICVYLWFKKKLKKGEENASIDPNDVMGHQIISYHELVHATNNFSEDNILGSGSFGKVFKGQLISGLVVAIKVLDMQLEQAIRSFDAECRVLRMTRHRNLIRILNTCSNLDFRALVLRYMPNGNLEMLLHGSESTTQHLRFLERLGIMLDVSMAMDYLHNEHYELILHCDLKPSNVLFDEEMTAHVADFGIARLLLDDNSMISASMPGTVGYMAPEYGSLGKASCKSDVFSYGIMLLEVFTRKRPTDTMFGAQLTLRQWVHEAYPAELVKVVDGQLLQDSSLSSCIFDDGFLALVFELGLICSSDLPGQRMTMHDVVVKLKKIKAEYNKRTTTT
ncbi:unnamed protein product [Alopecurus aequalis]